MKLRDAYIQIRPEVVEDKTFFDAYPRRTIRGWEAEVTGVTKTGTGVDVDFSMAATGSSPDIALLQLVRDMARYDVEVVS